MISQDDHQPGLSAEELIQFMSGNNTTGNHEEEWRQHQQLVQQPLWPRPAPVEAAAEMLPIPTSGTSRTQNRCSSHRGRIYHQTDTMLNAVQHYPSFVSTRAAAAQQLQCQQDAAVEMTPPSSFAPPHASLRRPSSPSENTPRDCQQRQWQAEFYPQDTTRVGRSHKGQGLALNRTDHHDTMNLATRHSSPQVTYGHERSSRLSLSPRPTSRCHANGGLKCGAPAGPSFSQHHQPRRLRTSSDELLESMLQRLSTDEKEQLLRQLLLSPKGVSHKHHPLQPRHVDLEISSSSRHNNKKTEAQLNYLSNSEKDMLNVQLGILLSFKKVEEEEEARRRRPQSGINSVNDRALEFAKNSSKREYLEIEKEAKLEQAMLEKAMIASLMDPLTPATEAVSKEEIIMEQTKLESLAYATDAIRRGSTISSSEECLMIENAKMESLRDNFHDRFIEDVKQESMAMGMPSSVECRNNDALCSISLRNSFQRQQRFVDSDQAGNDPFGLQVKEPVSKKGPPSILKFEAQRKSSRSSTTFPLTEDDASFEVEEYPGCMPLTEKPSHNDDLSLTESWDRKPPARQDPQVFSEVPEDGPGRWHHQYGDYDLSFLRNNNLRIGGSFDGTSHPTRSSRKSWRYGDLSQSEH